MIKLVVIAGFALSIAVSAQAMTPAPIPQPDSMITEVAAACGAGRTRVNGVCVARTTVRQQRWFHLLAREFGLTGQTPRNRSREKSGGEAGGLHRPYPSDGGGLSPSKGAAGGSEPSDPCGPPTEACWLLMPTRI